jgi:WD40 repeat protein
VSKDRQLALFRLNKETGKYELWQSDSSHSRIIRAVSFSHDDKYVATGARDKKIKIFELLEDKIVCRSEHTFK